MDNEGNDIYGNLNNQDDPSSRWNPNKAQGEPEEIQWGAPAKEGAMAEETASETPEDAFSAAGMSDGPMFEVPAYQPAQHKSVDDNSDKTPADEPDQRVYGTGKNKKKEKGNGSFGAAIGKAVACGLAFGIMGGAAFTGFNYVSGRVLGNSSVVSEEKTEEKAQNVTLSESVASSGTSTLNYDVASIVEATEASIVSITTTVTTSYQYFFQQYERQSTGAGSGIIIGKSDQNLFIATNYHVIEKADEINVGFVDGNIVKASVVGYDKNEDIAVVKVNFQDIESETSKKISIAKIGDSDQIRVGEPAIAIGNALGYGQSVTVGYISALNRMVEDSNETFIQTDAAINPGNSGGALINANGEVIGVNSVKYVDSSVEGMGFSIPINRAMSIIDGIISGKQDTTTYLGISGASISKEYAQIYGFPEGVYVREVQDNSPATKAGIHAGDIIVEFDGTESYTMEELQEMIRKKGAGDSVDIVVYRADTMGNYQKIKLTATLDVMME